MHNFRPLPKTISRITHFALIRMIINKLSQKQGNVRKVGQALTGKKADSPRNFFERNLILFMAFIFMILLANLGLILFFIFKFL
jgi:hypothetical protein